MRLPQEIDRADGEEVKRYLGPFIQDTWKARAEAEGEKIAGQLEGLAEEIIAVTNEDVATAMAILSRELGPADTKIDSRSTRSATTSACSRSARSAPASSCS